MSGKGNVPWTVARFPNGSWSTGGRPDSPDYEHCEVFIVMADSRESAKRKAQARRRRAALSRASGAASEGA